MDFNQLGICIDIVEIWFGIGNGQILSIFDRVIARNTDIFSFLDDNLSKDDWIFTKRFVHWYWGDLVWDC